MSVELSSKKCLYLLLAYGMLWELEESGTSWIPLKIGNRLQLGESHIYQVIYVV